MTHPAEQTLLNAEETAIIRFGDFKTFADDELAGNSATRIWRLLINLNKYAVLGKNDPLVYRSTDVLLPFMGSEADGTGRPSSPHRIVSEPQRKHFLATFAEIDPLQRYMEPDVTINQYGVGPNTYDVVKAYIDMRAITLSVTS